jgi:predicted dinucleotide-binding enzyme
LLYHLDLGHEGTAMAKAATKIDSGDVPAKKSDDHDVVHFLRRTLQAHTLDAQPADVLAKLQNLKTALEQQEITLAAWPASASKDRMCAALAKAKDVIAQIVDDFGLAAADHSDVSKAG